ncbi:MAG: GNAT family N-acetyltransferase [Clostridia bacterium]|nr:GNAT family N-acetyltransferase [Clostridia bacterium]
MEMRKTTLADLDEVMTIYKKARQFMRAHDNPTQWLGGKPTREQIEDDIAKQQSFVCIHQGKILGVLCFFVGNDPTYKEISGGNWLSDDTYAVVHRIASSGEVKGVGTFMMQWAFEKFGNVRVDTHEDNYVMQNMLKKLGYTYCGIIHLENGDPRLAYQKTV